MGTDPEVSRGKSDLSGDFPFPQPRTPERSAGGADDGERTLRHDHFAGRGFAGRY